MMRTEESESFNSDLLTFDEQEHIYTYVGNDIDVLLSDPNATCQLNDEETFQCEEFKPVFENHDFSALNNVLSNEEYSGQYEFEVLVIPNGTKNPWVFSPILNKVYMDMGNKFPVDFKIKNRPMEDLFIRITPQYSLSQDAPEPVYRCIQHEHPKQPSNMNISENIWQHVIRCSNQQAAYVGDKRKNERLSIVIPFPYPQTGIDTVREMFVFMCKNSCPMPGMNRRPLEIIFTLENTQRVILGRKSLSVRICSCPKRDKEKDEKEYNSKSANPLPRGKKRKVEKTDKKVVSNDGDTKEVELNLKIVGKDNAQQVLKYCADLMSGEILRRAGSSEVVAYKKCLDQINAIRNVPLE